MVTDDKSGDKEVNSNFPGGLAGADIPYVQPVQLQRGPLGKGAN